MEGRDGGVVARRQRRERAVRTRFRGLGFRVQGFEGLGFRVGFRVWGLGFRV